MDLRSSGIPTRHDGTCVEEWMTSSLLFSDSRDYFKLRLTTGVPGTIYRKPCLHEPLEADINTEDHIKLQYSQHIQTQNPVNHF